MRVLITGNLGYVGSVLSGHLRAQHPDAVLHGFDNAYFAHGLTGTVAVPERHLDQQFYGDVRALTPAQVAGYDAIVQLAAISNDPMGDRFEVPTMEINQDASVALARLAAQAGVRNYVFASSCSVYGVAAGGPRRESDALNPMTAYARSKIGTERALQTLDTDMTVSCLRFATACGMSDRLRLDLVLNDFVACALSQRRITVLSDGTPWRPLIDVADMARAIDWAISRPADAGGRYLAVNVGSNARNQQVRDLARAVAAAVPDTEVDINLDAPADSRSYRVDFSLFEELAPKHQPQYTLEDSITHLVSGLQRMSFSDARFRESPLIRLHVLQEHITHGRLTPSFHWRTPAPAH